MARYSTRERVKQGLACILYLPGHIPYYGLGQKQRVYIKERQSDFIIINHINANSSHHVGIYCLPGTVPAPSPELTLALATTMKIYIPQRETK